MRLIKPKCTECGSNDVTIDGSACWDMETQDWNVTHIELHICSECGHEMDDVAWETTVA